MEKEFEVKILNIDFEKLEKKLLDKRAHLLGEEEQMNIILNSKANNLEEELNGYMRIRITKDLLSSKVESTWTLKEFKSKNKTRKNLEYSTRIEDIDNTLRILGKLGYSPSNIGYKHRKSYIYRGARIDFDTWDKDTYPYPYVEIELENEEDLDLILEDLDISREKVSLKSIKELKKALE